jgi:hypothetical protein
LTIENIDGNHGRFAWLSASAEALATPPAINIHKAKSMPRGQDKLETMSWNCRQEERLKQVQGSLQERLPTTESHAGFSIPHFA